MNNSPIDSEEIRAKIAAMTAQKMQARLVALFTVQIIGLGLANILLYLGGSCYVYPTIRVYHERYIGVFSVVWIAVGITSCILFLTRPGFNAAVKVVNFIVSGINTASKDPWPLIRECEKKWWHVNLKWATRLLAALDMVGTALCIRFTGGVEVSIFTPFLLIIPTIIILVEIFEGIEILFWGCFCLAMFGLSLDSFLGFSSSKDPNIHHSLLIGATTVCTLFPFLFVKRSRANQPCPHCLGTGFISDNQSQPNGERDTNAYRASTLLTKPEEK